jgi:enoyl-CoA hydratase
MSLSGEPVTAEEIAQYGGINKVVSQDRLLETAHEMADKIARHSPTALRYYKASMNANEDARLAEKYWHEIGYSAKFLGDDDFREACAAFFEKREPHYTGK